VLSEKFIKTEILSYNHHKYVVNSIPIFFIHTHLIFVKGTDPNDSKLLKGIHIINEFLAILYEKQYVYELKSLRIMSNNVTNVVTYYVVKELIDIILKSKSLVLRKTT